MLWRESDVTLCRGIREPHTDVMGCVTDRAESGLIAQWVSYMMLGCLTLVEKNKFSGVACDTLWK